jgi:single-strand DNA-binding protein
MNKVFLRGVVTKDIELKSTQNKTAMTKFSIAVRRDIKNANGEYDTDFINCIAFGKIAETISKYFHKGSGILVMGHIQTGSYEKEDGGRVYTTDIIVENIEFDRSNSNKETEKEKEEPKQKLSDEPFESFGRQVTIDESELPF